MNTADRLLQAFTDAPGVVVAFSGGVDSTLVAAAARRALGRERMWAVISQSDSLKRSELAAARQVAAELDLPLREVTSGEFDNPDYLANPNNRCFHCKTALYTVLHDLPEVSAHGWWVCNGTNTDDLGDYRPGLQAAAAFEVHSPLVEAGLDKAAVRNVAREWSIPVWDKPAAPCLASRIPYGQPVTREKLTRIEAAEAVLEHAGFPVNRVRHHEDRAVLEVPEDHLSALRKKLPELLPALRNTGLPEVQVDDEGFVSGKLNRSLS